jgi:hypothetical protein
LELKGLTLEFEDFFKAGSGENRPPQMIRLHGARRNSRPNVVIKDGTAEQDWLKMQNDNSGRAAQSCEVDPLVACGDAPPGNIDSFISFRVIPVWSGNAV